MKTIFLILLFSTLGTSVMLSKDNIKAQEFVINDNGYISNSFMTVLAFHNHYVVGKQGGIEFLYKNERIATNGNIAIRLKDGTIIQKFAASRQIDNINKKILIEIEFEQQQLKFHFVISPERNGVKITVNPDKKIQEDIVQDVYFEMDFYPGFFAGSSYSSENDFGIFPHHYLGGTLRTKKNHIRTKLMTEGNSITFAPGDAGKTLQMQSENCSLELFDDRFDHHINWFRIRTRNALNKSFGITFTHQTMKVHTDQVRMLYSRVGYHPVQEKVVLFESFDGLDSTLECKLVKIEPSGHSEVVMETVPQYWGTYMAYSYATFSFSSVQTPGIYKLEYENTKTDPFLIHKDVYKRDVWQPTLGTFMPVQMCHMRVKDRNRIWHDVCHMDDGLQAPVNTDFFDGFRQNASTEARFEPETTITGMNIGGWHDAGDDDINTGSNGRNIYSLALAFEEFGIDMDETTVDFERNETFLHQPDGIPDAIQQIIHGIHWILAHFNNADHSFVGAVSSDFLQYLQAGDWAGFSDNLFYNPSFDKDSAGWKYSGKHDDRYIFTNRDSRRDYFVSALLSASARVLRKYDPELSEKCITVAQKIWDYESHHEPVIFSNVGTPNNLIAERINAAVELFLTSKDEQYLGAIYKNIDDISDNFQQVAWTISRVVDDMDNAPFMKFYQNQLKIYVDELSDSLYQNPFGTVDRYQVWGVGWEILWMLYKHYYLIKKYPDKFPKKDLYNGVHYMFGRHPANNLSLVSGVGQHKPIPAFGINRHHFSYIIGGVFSGPAKILPDFVELKDDTPYIWQQSEYIISGAGPYIFCVLAADAFLKE